MSLKRGQNPRSFLKNHSERGGKTFRPEVTYSKIAKNLRLTESAVRQAVHRGELDPSSFDSLFEYIIHRLNKKPLSEESLKSLVERARDLVDD